MKQLADYIFKDIVHSLRRNSDKQVIRVDGFENLGLYLRLCRKTQELCAKQGYSLIAKLSCNKFEQFVAAGKWPAEVSAMRMNDWVDEEDHMTSYRNMLPDSGKRLVVLLLGTDMVDDKGGLNDFFAITPNKIDVEIGNKFSKLISQELHDAFDNAQIDDVVDRFFGDLFSCTPKNLSQVSDILDGWLNETPTVKEAMVDLFTMLPQWNIPMIQDAAEKLTPVKFISARGKSSLVLKASNFIRGKTYARITKSTIANMKKKFEQYRGEDGKQPGKYYMEYPTGQKITSLAQLEAAAISYVMGDHSEDLCDTLIHTDFSILDDVLNIKLTTKKSTDKIIKVEGMPLSVFLMAFLSALDDNEMGIDAVRFNWQQARLCGIPSNVEVADASEKDALLLDSWNAITRFTGGIGEYISQENWQGHDGEPISLCMEPSDFFLPSAGKSLVESGLVTTGSGAKHKINFTIEALCNDTTIATEDFVWEIDPMEAWLLAFRDLDDMPEEETCYLPFETSAEMNTAYSLKDEDGFAYWITHTDVKPLVGNSSLWNTLDRELQQAEEDMEQARFFKLGKCFQNFRKQVMKEGFFASINSSASIFLNEYLALVDHIATCPVYVGKLHTLVGKERSSSTMPLRGSCRSIPSSVSR
ncbi:MAG: hypothetical protein PHI98_03930 [Eubacteriales bacterium]|nr:hypothetical protein [Eubacteriales bacterium]